MGVPGSIGTTVPATPTTTRTTARIQRRTGVTTENLGERGTRRMSPDAW